MVFKCNVKVYLLLILFQYLLVMSIVIAAELYVGCHTYGVPNDIKKINEKNLNEIFGNVTSEDSFKIRTNNDAISIQQSVSHH